MPMGVVMRTKADDYQRQYFELANRVQMLQNQIPAIQAEMQNLQMYCTSDRNARAKYSKLVHQLNGITATINRSQMRMQKLQNMIAAENTKMMVKQQRAMAKSMAKAYRY